MEIVVEKQLCPWTERMTERRKENERNKKCVNRKPILLSFVPSLHSYSEMNLSAERIRHEDIDVHVHVNSHPPHHQFIRKLVNRQELWSSHTGPERFLTPPVLQSSAVKWIGERNHDGL